MQSTSGTRKTSSRRSESQLTAGGTVRTPPGTVRTRFSLCERPSTSAQSLRRQELPGLQVPAPQLPLRARTTRSSAATIPGAISNVLTLPTIVTTSKRSSTVKATLPKTKSTEKAAMKRLSKMQEEPILPKRTKPVETKSVAAQTDKRYAMSKASDWDANDSFNFMCTFTCPVCFHSTYADSDAKEKISVISVGDCGHCFCHNCSLMIYKANPKCPLCQKRLALKDFRRIYI